MRNIHGIVAVLATLTLTACGGGGGSDSIGSSGGGSSSSSSSGSSSGGSSSSSSSSSSGGSSSSSSGGVTGSVEFSSATFAVDQTVGSVKLTVDRSNGASGAAAVTYQTSYGSADGTRFTSASGTLNWNAGDPQPKSFTVTLSTAPFLGSLSFTAALSDATGASLGTPTATTVTITGSLAVGSGTSAAARLAQKLGKPEHFLVGLGQQGDVTGVIAKIQGQGLTPEIYERYLGGVGSDWTTWNQPAGAYVGIVAGNAKTFAAVPMFTLYQMAINGEDNMSALTNASFMTTYWSHVRLMYQQIALTGSPTLVNLEPDFWGFTEQKAKNADPATVSANVTTNADCATLSNDVKGIAACLIQMARKYAPKAYVGFPYSTWGASTTASVVAWMKAIGAQNADFIVAQTLDRDAGCYEALPQPSYCQHQVLPWYWDSTNQLHPNFADHLAEVQAFHAGLGNLPVIWWQTPMGVASTVSGGTPYHYRDNRAEYFLAHTADLVAVGGLGVVFSTGENHQTNLTTDGGQFQRLSTAYFAAPTGLP